VIGIILTGFLNDGTAGMWAIKQSGGYCIVQDPNEAQYPDMPLAVLDKMEVDETVSLKDMGDRILLRMLQADELKGIQPPATVIAESKLSERAATGIEKVSALGEKSVYACPIAAAACGKSRMEILYTIDVIQGTLIPKMTWC